MKTLIKFVLCTIMSLLICVIIHFFCGDNYFPFIVALLIFISYGVLEKDNN